VRSFKIFRNRIGVVKRRYAMGDKGKKDKDKRGKQKQSKQEQKSKKQ